MFNLFKKKSQHPIATIFSNVTTGQKQSISNLLLFVGSCDCNDKPHPEEMKLLNSYIDIFDIRADQARARYEANGVKGLINDLETLSKDQKEFLVTMVHDMICVDGQPNEAEMECAINFLNPIGISDDKYIEIISKAHAMRKTLLG